MKNKWKMALSAAATAALVACSFGNTPENTVEQFYDAAQDNNATRMMELVHPDGEMVMFLGEEKVEYMFSEMAQEYSRQDLDLVSVECEGNDTRAQCETHFTLNGGNNAELLHLRESNGQWLISHGERI